MTYQFAPEFYFYIDIYNFSPNFRINNSVTYEHFFKWVLTSTRLKKVFVCKFCTCTQENIARERSDEEEETKPFICAECGKAFKHNHQLKYHVNQHKDVKPFVCDICNKTFMNSRNLRDHSSIHTGIIQS